MQRHWNSKKLILVTLVGFSLGAVQAPPVRANSVQANSVQANPVQLSYRTYHYTCTGGQRVSVAYVQYGKNGPSFAVLNYVGQQYGLAQAPSASGARYASLFGPQTAKSLGSGLEWWEWHGEATLNVFVGSDTSKTRPLLTKCRPLR